jgi:transcriptional regulator with XRE-family HTH domain
MKTRLRELRKSYGLTLRELDEKVNINYSQLARIERGEGSLTQQHIQILSSFFNVSSDYLLGINENSNNSIVAEKIPVYSELYGGNQVLRKEHLMYHSFAPGNIDLYDCVYLQASNDNKEESISSGDLLLVKLGHAVDSGLFVVAKKNERGEVRRLLEVNGEWFFLENNRVVNTSSYDIIGKVLMVTRIIK